MCTYWLLRVSFSFYDIYMQMQWLCKDCRFQTTTRTILLKHYKLQHGHIGRNHPQLCLYQHCPCTFTTWNSLQAHLSRSHSADENEQFPTLLASFKCLLCDCLDVKTEKDFFDHLYQHLRNHENVACVFNDCTFETNVYSTYTSHKCRKHNPHCLNDFRSEIVTIVNTSQGREDEGDDEDLSNEVDIGSEDNSADNSGSDIEVHLASFFLKLKSVFHVSNVATQEIVDEIKFIASSGSLSGVKSILSDTLKKHNLNLDEHIIQDLADSVYKSNPVLSAIDTSGPLGTDHRRTLYYKEHFNVVDPVEYALDEGKTKTFQYVPILKSIQQILNREDLLREALDADNVHSKRQSGDNLKYKTYRDGKYFKSNDLLCSNEFRLCLTLYVDDFEICNPLGTSRKKHKVCGVYWTLSNLPLKLLSELNSINVAILCKTADVKAYGYAKVLEPLLQDLVKLEQEGVFISALDKKVKGTVLCVVADNLGAHGIGGFVESFNGNYVCRFCTGLHSDFQKKEVRWGEFEARTKASHADHINIVEQDPRVTNCFGVKKGCVLTEKLQYFHVVSGYPPDLLHDLFEGIVPRELALCLTVLISKKYCDLNTLNERIKSFPFKYNDKVNSSQSLPKTFSSTRSIGGNAHENWHLLRFLPFIIGPKIPHDEPAWQILMILKDIVELAVSPTHSEESIGYLDCKISEHRLLFQALFPDEKLLPKHHFLEHYPEKIREFGPLAALWTMRFEGKHRYFKQTVRYTGCFKNILLTLSRNHQLMMAYHLHSSSRGSVKLEVNGVSTLSFDVLKEAVAKAVKDRYGKVAYVHMAKQVCYHGTIYNLGMILTFGSLSGLPCFVEIVQIIIQGSKPSFIVKKLSAWYDEHLRSFELHTDFNSIALIAVEPHELNDFYPLVAYSIARRRMVTLKAYIHSLWYAC